MSTSTPAQQTPIMSRYQSVLYAMQQRAQDEGNDSADFAYVFDYFHEEALGRYPHPVPDTVKFETERDTWNHYWPREAFPGQYVNFRAPPPPVNASPAKPETFECKSRHVIVNPLLGSGKQPLYGLDAAGFPFWCFLLPLSELELFKGEKDINLEELERTFGVLICIHEVKEYFLVYPEHPEDVPQQGLIPVQANMDRFYKFVHLLDREARGMNGGASSKERIFPKNYLAKFLEEEKNGLLNWHTPQPPRPLHKYYFHRKKFLPLSHQHLRHTPTYRAQFRKLKNPPPYTAKAAWSSSWLPQNYDNGHTGATLFDNERAEKGINLDRNKIVTARNFQERGRAVWARARVVPVGMGERGGDEDGFVTDEDDDLYSED